MYTYSLNVERKTYTLPPKTIYVVEEMDKVAQVDSIRGMSVREKYNVILGFIVNLLGEANAKEILGSTLVEEVDPSVVTITFRMIVDAYNKPIADYNARKSNDIFSGIPMDKLEKMTKLAEAAEKVARD
jgi:hypothetical protein